MGVELLPKNSEKRNLFLRPQIRLDFGVVAVPSMLVNASREKYQRPHDIYIYTSKKKKSLICLSYTGLNVRYSGGKENVSLVLGLLIIVKA